MSRSVDRPTQASAADEAAYRAADPVPDGSAAAEPSAGGEPETGSDSGTTERAARELSDAPTSEPTRSE